MSDLDGLWAMRFEDFEQLGIRNGGTVVILRNRLYGGDGHFYYLGEIEVNGSRGAGLGSITHYSGRDLSAYGITVADRMEIEFSGEISGDKVEGHMWPTGRESPMLRFTMERLAGLE